jgi:pimeloyl-ACP methyl ester carboxylesterase
VSERQFELSDKRRMGITAAGNPFASRWVLFCHPAPGAGGFDPDPLVTDTCPLDILSFDRPGYGSSDPWTVPPQPSPQRWVLDVQEFLETCRTDAESIGHAAYRDLAVFGWREGCIYAAVLAAALGDQVSAVAFIEPMTLSQAARSLAESDAWDVDRLMPGIDSDAASEFAGLRSRLQRMLGIAREQGEAGLDADRAAVKQQVLDESLDAIRAPALILISDTKERRSAANRYAKRLPDARIEVADTPVPIAGRWSRLVEYFES